MKNKPDPVALEDSEYPAWLWSVLAKSEEAGDSSVPSEGDLFGMYIAHQPRIKTKRTSIADRTIQRNRRSNGNVLRRLYGNNSC